MSTLLLMVVKDPVAANTIREAAQADDLDVLELGSLKEAMATARSVESSLIIVEWGHGDADHVLELSKKADGAGSANDVPIIVVANEEDTPAGTKAAVADWLIRPFSSAYARARIQACLLRRACRWERALTAQDEERRLAALHALGILDTPAEERFDRITRLAASVFKSTHGLNVAETSRETSFCSHAVSLREVLVVPDTFQDDRFSDNPLVTQVPRIRFYAGCPIFVEGNCVGTVCVLDNRPRQFDAEAVNLLRDLAALAEVELCRPQRMSE